MTANAWLTPIVCLWYSSNTVFLAMETQTGLTDPTMAPGSFMTDGQFPT